MARTIETNLTAEDIKIEGSLRPKFLKDYIGQQKIKEILSIYIDAAKKREEGRRRRVLGCQILCWRKGALELGQIMNVKHVSRE